MFHDFVDEVWALENQVGSQGRIQNFKLGGEHLKKLRRAKKSYFFQFKGGGAGCAPPWIRPWFL
jgi:hypothetical protein